MLIIHHTPTTAASGISDVLRQVDVPIMSNAGCNAVYGIVTDGNICIDSTGGKGTCNVCRRLHYDMDTYYISAYNYGPVNPVSPLGKVDVALAYSELMTA